MSKYLYNASNQRSDKVRDHALLKWLTKTVYLSFRVVTDIDRPQTFTNY